MSRTGLTPYGPPIALDLKTRRRFEAYVEWIREKERKELGNNAPGRMTKSRALNYLLDGSGFDVKDFPLL